MSRPSARPKRAGEDFTRTHYDEEDGPATKKLRFDPRNPSALAPDALEDDAILEVDEIGRRGQQVKRNAVNLDGYDSDSDNENFNARAEARSKANQKSKDDDDDDNMFAELEDDFKDGDEDEDTAKGGKKKAVRFLENDEIEGQVASSKSGGHVSGDFTLNGKAKGQEDEESGSESEVDDATRAAIDDGLDEELGAGAKKTHAPKLDAFNMRNEQEEGRFDEHGNYVRKAADPDAVHDTWLEGISSKEMKKAAEAAQKRDQLRREKDVANDAKLTSDLLGTLITILQRGETSLEALARLGKGKEKKPKWQTKQKNRKKDPSTATNDTGDVHMAEDDPAEVKRKATIEALTDAADLLLSRGQPEIYDVERELLVRQYRRETGEDWKDPPPEANGDGDDAESGPKMWEYRWSDARDGGEVHGPYDGPTMVQWNDAGYFGEGVEFRRAGTHDEWNRVVDFV